MITINDKIESFKKIIHDEIENKFSSDIKQIEDETKDLLIKHKEKSDKEIEKLKREYEQKLEQKKDKISSKLQKEGQDILLSTNKEIYEEFFKALNERVSLEYQKEAGEKYLRNILENSKSDIKKDDIICVFAKTYDRDKSIITSILGDIDVKKSNNIKIGGFEVENNERTYRNNYSLDLIIEKNYKNILTKLKKELGMIA